MKEEKKQRPLNRRVTLTPPPTQTDDGIGGFNTVAVAGTDVWAAVTQLSGNVSLSYGLALGTAAYEFDFRYEAAKAVTLRYTLTYLTRVFAIARITNIEERFKRIKIVAYERAD